MALAGAAAAAATAWMTQPAAGRLCPDIARVPILAGAIAAGLDVTVMESIMVESATYEQDVRDFCDDVIKICLSQLDQQDAWLSVTLPERC